MENVKENIYQNKYQVPDGNRNSMVNFGFKGWFIIFYCMAIFFFYVGMVNDGSNITSPAVAAKLGVNNGVVMSMNSLAGIIGILFFIAIGKINTKFGSRKTSGVLLIISGLSYIVIGRVNSLLVYTISMSFVVGTIMSAGYISGGNLVAQWFPKKKGIVMGYTTMGLNLASAFYVPLIAFLLGKLGLEVGIIPIGLGVIFLGIIGFIYVRDTPQEYGLNPDNVADFVYKNEYDLEDPKESDRWTTKSLLKTKELWMAAFATGIFQICSVGVMSQLVLRNMELGFEQNQAILIMTVLALVGVGGSWLIGLFDQKLGTKRTMIGFALWYALALFCNYTNISYLIYLSLFMIAIGIGGSANFMTSLPAAIYGRHGFAKVNSVIFPIQGAITAMCFLINGVVQIFTGGEIRNAYLAFAILALLNILIIKGIDEHKYNRDFKVEENL
jgi:OFA family oxalate/formate antiporter-like MFS transporter